jgi:hypothetical protein
LLRSGNAKDLVHGFSDPNVQQIAIEARMPNHRISNVGNFFRRLQPLKVERSQRWFCDSRWHRQHQVCGLKDSDGSLEIRKMDSYVPPQSSFSDRSDPDGSVAGCEVKKAAQPYATEPLLSANGYRSTRLLGVTEQHGDLLPGV